MLGVTLWQLVSNSYPFDNIQFQERMKSWGFSYFERQLPKLMRLSQILPADFIDFIVGLVKVNPQEERLTIDKALSLPLFQQKKYLFDSMREQEDLFQQVMFSSAVKVTESVLKIPTKTLKEQDKNYTSYYLQQYTVTKTYANVPEKPNPLLLMFQSLLQKHMPMFLKKLKPLMPMIQSLQRRKAV